MKIHAIQTGTVRIKTAQTERPAGVRSGMLAIFADRNWTDWVPTYAWLIDHREGLIVVDTGQGTHLLQHARSWHPFVRWEVAFRVEPEQEIGPQLAALGVGARDVKRVVLTHLHMDHDGGLRHFPASEILVAPGELALAKGWMGMLRGYLPNRWPSWFDPVPLELTTEPVGPFAASKRLTQAGDVVAVATPGHTAHHVSVLVHDDDGAVLLAGDTSYTQDLMLAGKVDSVSPDVAVSKVTLAAIKQFASAQPTLYLPTHDPGSGTRLAQRTVAPTGDNRPER
jgi:glyoxylase-like metal-dependent hydrolase (beta-lactamase superfamily II)